jgi:hypothetical protein
VKSEKSRGEETGETENVRRRLNEENEYLLNV